MNSEPLDQDSPIVQEVTQSVTNHGWLILPSDVIDLITETKQALAAYDQRQFKTPPLAQTPSKAPAPSTFAPPTNYERMREAEKLIRAALPERLHTPDGDQPEIPDDLYEELAAILADHKSGA